MSGSLPRLMSLAEAAQALGLPTKSALATEIRRGRLTPTIVAGKRYVTEDALREFVERCHAPRDRASTSVDARAALRPGSFSTPETKLAQAAAKMTVEALRQRSRPTSQANTPRRPT